MVACLERHNLVRKLKLPKLWLLWTELVQFALLKLQAG